MDGAGQTALIGPGDCQIEAGENVAGEPRHSVLMTDVPIATHGNANLDLLTLRAIGAALRAQQIAGALERVTAMTTQYALDRTQFGRPIGKFQAVQQNLAILLV